MLHFPHPGCEMFQTNWSGRVTSTIGTLVTAHATPNTLGSKTELIASTNFTTCWVEVIIHSTISGDTDTDSLINIYVGGSGSEQLLIPNLLAGWSAHLLPITSTAMPKTYRFPLRIPKGSRISADMQAIIGGDTARVIINLLGGPTQSHWVGQAVECIGADIVNSRGATVTPGTTSNGDLVSIGSPTLDWGFVLPHIGGVSTVNIKSGIETVDVGISTGVIAGLENFMFAVGYSGDEGCGTIFNTMGRFHRIPAGTGLYLRARFSGDAEDKDYCIYGVY